MNQEPEIKLGLGTVFRGREAIRAVGWTLKLWLIARAISRLAITLCAVYWTFNPPITSAAIQLFSLRNWRSFF
jgi:hypothetical protein